MSLNLNLIDQSTIEKYIETENCGICLEPLKEVDPTTRLFNEVVGHEEGGELHPFHKKCLKLCIVKDLNCPACRQPIHPMPILSTKEKIVHYANSFWSKFSLVAVLEEASVITAGIAAGVIPGLADLFWSNEILHGMSPPFYVLTAVGVVALGILGAQLPDNVAHLPSLIDFGYIGLDIASLRRCDLAKVRRVIGSTVVSTFVIAYLHDKTIDQSKYFL